MNISEIKKNSTCVIQHCRGSYDLNLSFGLKNVNTLSVVCFANVGHFFSGINYYVVYPCKQHMSTGVVI